MDLPEPTAFHLDANWYRVGYNLAANQLHAALLDESGSVSAPGVDPSAIRPAFDTAVELCKAAVGTLHCLDNDRKLREREGELYEFLSDTAEQSALALLGGLLIESPKRFIKE